MPRIKMLTPLGVVLFPVWLGMGSTYPGDGGEKVTICHHAGPTKQFEIEVAAAAVPGHLRHGDSEGACGGDT